MRNRIRFWKFSLTLAVVLVFVNLAIGPSPNAKLGDFALAHENLRSSRVVKCRGSRSDYYELRIATVSGMTFYLSDPEPDVPQRYLAVLPTNGLISIRFRDDRSGHRIFQVCDSASELIPFSETMASVASRRRFGFGFAIALALLGICSLCWEHRKHAYTRQKPA